MLEFVLEIYEVLKTLPEYESRNIFSQLQRASTSIILNIAEGASNKSNKVFFNHLQYSYGSCKEIKVLLMLTKDLEYIEEKLFSKLFTSLDILTATIFKFMQSVEKEINLRKPNYSFDYIRNK